MIVKLSLLDRQPVVHYSTVVDVYTYIDSYERIGTCRVFREVDGRHYGELSLDVQVSGDLYFYYRAAANEGGIFIFTGLDFMQNELEHSRTTRLKEMIVD